MFTTVLLNRSNVVSATAVGHPSDVIDNFHRLCSLLFSGKGAWRITKVEGTLKDSEALESMTTWSLKAKLKSQ